MELMISPNSKKQIKKYIKGGSSTFLFGLKDYAVHNSLYLSVDEIKKLRQTYPEITLFISINKMLFNDDIDKLAEILTALDKLNIKGLFFYDLALITLKKRLHLSLALVWNQTHMVTNYKTCNYYYEQGVEYATVANEITVEEILQINQNTNIKLIMSGLGFPIVSHTKRKLLTNYFNYYHKKNRKKLYHINCGENKYFIYEEKDGSTIFKDALLNITSILDPLMANDIPYLILNGFNINPHQFDKLVFAFQAKLLNRLTTEELNNQIQKVYFNDSNFFLKKTIYKVKPNED